MKIFRPRLCQGMTTNQTSRHVGKKAVPDNPSHARDVAFASCRQRRFDRFGGRCIKYLARSQSLSCTTLRNAWREQNNQHANQCPLSSCASCKTFLPLQHHLWVQKMRESTMRYLQFAPLFYSPASLFAFLMPVMSSIHPSIQLVKSSVTNPYRNIPLMCIFCRRQLLEN